MKTRHDCTLYLHHCVLMFLYTSSHSVFIITDVSKSKFCNSGLLSGKDVLELEIRFNFTEARRQLPIELFFVHPNNVSFSKVCQVNVEQDCSNETSGHCTCSLDDDERFLIRFRSEANIGHGNSWVQINTQILPGFKLPAIFNAHENVSLQVNDKDFFISKEKCSFPAPLNSKAFIRLCSSTTLDLLVNLTYADDKESIAAHNSCAYAQKEIVNFKWPLYLEYQDGCGRHHAYTCYVTDYHDNMNKNNDANENNDDFPCCSDDQYEVDNAIALMFSFTLLIIILSFCLVFCYMRRILCFRDKFERRSRLTIVELRDMEDCHSTKNSDMQASKITQKSATYSTGRQSRYGTGV